MLQYGRLAVQDFPSHVDPAAKAGNDALLAHANPKHGNFTAKILDGRLADTRVSVWMARPGADNQLSRLLCDQFLQGDFVIAVDGDGRTLQDEVLVDIPGERVIVIDQNDIGGSLNPLRLGGMVG